ncbi:NAD(P)H-quinone oxidoreductase subunit I [Ruminiclostridium hungatei]|uniref:NAD(P)H-quinone oxidoreductase subunit I n=1 Tax=Ruminiclostridium hungatei TaxID=48256 RepID=A0A1V4SNR6_RUMHU|nr:Coenzyme F420 hydrogenase/dehydrogenase, beta subunit C-terminal domain [Ruminiclostridium hungatei]OPX45529.1 NAD(P)H-quinone oxidoreductase subunit I [Ruminiclostridium hungatei]
MNSVFDNKNDCFGCAACVQVCPSGAIAFPQDSEGFRYPEIDAGRCTDCGLCRKSCPIFKDIKSQAASFPQVYAMWSKDENIRSTSTSGGVFTVLAKHVLSKGGVVFGAAFDENLRVAHTGVYDQEQLWRLQGSKYAQSVTGDTFKEVKALLQAGKTVLYSGTPCQTGGLYSYLGKDHKLLYTCDCVCHGVPSPLVFELYKSHLEKIYASEIQSFNFRNKSAGWKNYNIKVDFKNGRQHRTDFKADPYMRGFTGNMYLRPSCHGCRYASVQRQSDITLADFWGVARFDPGLDDDKGTSLILVNSPAGLELLEACGDELTIHKADLPAAARENPSLTGPSSPHRRRGEFFSQMARSDFAALEAKFLRAPSKVRLLWRRCIGIPRRMAKIILRKS